MERVTAMLEVERRRFGFKLKEIWFAEYPFNVGGCDSVAFHACKQRVDADGFTRQEQTTLTIDLSQDLDAILRNMSKRSRRGIRDAKRFGVEIVRNQEHEKFRELYLAFRRAMGLSLRDSWGGLDFVKRYGTLFVAELDGQMLVGRVYVEDLTHIRALISGSARLNLEKERQSVIAHANRLITWEAILYAKNKGIKEFDLGGYYFGKEEQMERVNFFKSGFGGKLTPLYEYRKDYSRLFRFASKVYNFLLVKVRFDHRL
jgi:hypothetical protein